MNDVDKQIAVCVLISCMNQDKSIIERTRVQSHVVVVNQCDEESIEEWDFLNKDGKSCHAKFISTKERGLSRSRNMAIRNAIGDICLISDDDEQLTEGYEAAVIEAYKRQGQADLISFAFVRKDKQFSDTPFMHNLRSLLKTSSVEITFLRESVIANNIWFDEKMGSGSGNGAGEENMFLMTCKRKGLQMYYDPFSIGRLLSTDSMWFKGYNERYFENFGWASRRIMGAVVSLAYLCYWFPAHRGLYIKDISMSKAIKGYLRGWKSKR